MTVETVLADRLPPKLPRESAPGSAPLIELRHVSKSYSGTDGAPPVTVLDDINLEVRDGEMLALLGQSGSGKSTILRLMVGLTDPTQGAILSHGSPLHGVNHRLAIVFRALPSILGLRCRKMYRLGSFSAVSIHGRKRTKSAGHSHSSASPATRMRIPSNCPVACGSVSALRGRSSLSRRCCAWTSHLVRSTCSRRRTCARRWSNCGVAQGIRASRAFFW